jgi:ABC-2 type transport system permease protein
MDMNALSIALKDMQIFFKDRNAILALLVLPLVFILIFVGLGQAGAGGDEGDDRIPMPVVNLDPDGAMVETLLEQLNTAGGVKTALYGEAEAQAMMDEGEIFRLLTIPAGFSADMEAGRTATLLLTSASDDPDEDRTVTLAVQGVARNLSLLHQIIASLEQMGEMQAANPETEQAFTTERTIEQAESQFERSRTRPLVAVSQILPRSLGEREESEFNPVQVGVPGMTVLFVFLTAQATARSIHDEKRTGSFRRLLAAPLSKVGLLVGKMVPNLLTGILQVVVIFGVSALLFPLIGLDRLALGEHILALVLLVLVVVLCSTAMGVLIAAIARTEAQIGGISQALLWIMAFIGGSNVPTFLVSDALATIGRITPHGWANVAFYDVLVRGQGLAAVTDSLLALLAFSAVFFAVGVWRFEFE